MAENGSCIVHVENGSIEKLAESERNVGESGLNHASMKLTNIRGVFARVQQCKSDVCDAIHVDVVVR